jgi:hypothetical protein
MVLIQSHIHILWIFLLKMHGLNSKGIFDLIKKDNLRRKINSFWGQLRLLYVVDSCAQQLGFLFEDLLLVKSFRVNFTVSVCFSYTFLKNLYNINKASLSVYPSAR